MIRAIRNFLNQEKMYSWLLIISIFLYSFFLMFSEDEGDSLSPAMEKIKEVKASFEGKDNQGEIFWNLLKDDESLAITALLFMMLFLFLIGAGFLVVVYCLVNLLLGRKIIQRAYDQASIKWENADIVKIIILFVFVSMISGVIIGFINDLFFEDAENSFIIIHTLITDVAALFFIIYFVTVKYKSSIRDIGLNSMRFFNDIFLGFSTYCVVLPVLLGIIILLSVIVNYFHYEPPPHPLVDIFVVEDKQNPLLIMFSIFLACTIGPFIEEVFFRGFCYSALKKKWGIRVAMISTAAFFALIHGSSFAFIPVFILGLILAFLFEKRGTLIPSITLHIIHNSLFISYFFIMKRVLLDRLG